MKTLARSFLCIGLLSLTLGCNKNDPQPTLDEEPFFTFADLVFLHEGRSKTWSVKNYYSDYSNNVVSDDLPCIQDDTYTFYADRREGDVILGDNSCYWDEPDGEAGIAVYTYFETSGELFLDHGRNEVKDANSSASIEFLKLRSITANEAVFANGPRDNWGTTLVLSFD